jgi:hypothetical protein
MGLGENIFGTTTIHRTFSRPFPPGVDGEIMRDAYTGISYKWSGADVAWIPFGTTEQTVDFYINPVTGSDTDVGNAANPLATIQEAFDRLPPTVLHRVTIDLADNGAIQLYDEAVHIKNHFIQDDIDVVGKDRVFTPATGPSSVPAHAANTGDNFQITVNDPGHVNWTAGDLVGKYALFTAGPRAGAIIYILANTVNSIQFGSHPFPVIEGPYGAADAFTIYEITTQIRQNTLLNTATLVVNNVTGRDTSGESFLSFIKVHLIGDKDQEITGLLTNDVYVKFDRSRIDDAVLPIQTGMGIIEFVESGMYPGATSVVASTLLSSMPSWNGNVVILDTGVLGTIIFNGWGANKVQILNSNILPDPGGTPDENVRFGGGILSMLIVGIDGQSFNVPIRLTGQMDVDRGSGLIELLDVEIKNSSGSGVETQLSDLAQIDIVVDDIVIFDESDFYSNTDYGLDISGPCTIVFGGAARSSVANGTAGMRLRHKAIAKYSGPSGDEPDIHGPGGAGVDEIDFDDRDPAFFRQFTDDTRFASDTHAAYIQEPSGGPP